MRFASFSPQIYGDIICLVLHSLAVRVEKAKGQTAEAALTSVMWDFVYLRHMLVTRIILFIFTRCVDSVVETLSASCLQCEKQESQSADIFFSTQPKNAFECGVDKLTCSKHDKN